MLNENNKRKKILQIVIPIILIIIITSIWIIKNSDNNNLTKNNVSTTENNDFDLNVTKKIDIEKLKSYHLPIIIDFGSDECIPCKKMAPVLKELHTELYEKAIIQFVDVWKYNSLAEGYPVNMIPTQIFIGADGKAHKPSDKTKNFLKTYTSESGEHTFTVHEGGISKEELKAILLEMGLKE